MDDHASLVAVFAHELRNALSPARAASELLQRREAGNQPLIQALKAMDKSLASTLRTVDRFVEADRIFAGTLRVDVGSVRLAATVERALALARPILDERRQRVEQQLGADDICVEADSGRIAQVIAQLIENAAVNAPEGSTIVVAARADDSSVELMVRDPVPREDDFDVNRAFESLRATAHTQGLALATARRLMQLQHGELSARVDRDTRLAEFVVRVARSHAAPDAVAPAAATATQAAQRAVDTKSRRAPSRILLVDDNRVVRNMYREALEELGYEVMLAATGEEALQVADQSTPEVALIDAHLPTLNGYQVARALRARHPSTGIKLVLLSGMTLDENLVRLSKNAGFDHCVDKGAGPQAVDALLRQ